ncbi:MAG: F0F1 ATP synthase subunit delta [Cyanobacteria bacterium CRU_2_1]|nr:F0F1 ATP synthase subunit delta [Cyanobacteria bacterium RU_5_0]NJR60243.1 F0F1 ATP synthase subunit delta [Cyanobacteria bacterium CRU_2_1]
MKSTLLATEIAEPYSQALMSLAKDQNLTDRIGEDVNSLLTVLKESEDLRRCLMSPLVSLDVKKVVLRRIASDQLHPYTLNFLLLLVDRGRIPFVEEICKQYQELLRKLKQAVLAEVTSAVPLLEAQRESIRQKVQSYTQAHYVDMENVVNPDLLGGVIIKVGSQIIDVSLRGQLRRIGVRLTSTT